MTNALEVPGENEGLARYFASGFVTRKLIVDLCVELYEMTHDEQKMLLDTARAYRKSKPAVDLAPKRPTHLRLVA